MVGSQWEVMVADNGSRSKMIPVDDHLYITLEVPSRETEQQQNGENVVEILEDAVDKVR